jgi:hypothetical protein
MDVRSYEDIIQKYKDRGFDIRIIDTYNPILSILETEYYPSHHMVYDFKQPADSGRFWSYDRSPSTIEWSQKGFDAIRYIGTILKDEPPQFMWPYAGELTYIYVMGMFKFCVFCKKLIPFDEAKLWSARAGSCKEDANQNHTMPNEVKRAEYRLALFMKLINNKDSTFSFDELAKAERERQFSKDNLYKGIPILAEEKMTSDELDSILSDIEKQVNISTNYSIIEEDEKCSAAQNSDESMDEEIIIQALC